MESEQVGASNRNRWADRPGIRIEALNEAIHKFGPPEIMNTDQGSQFTSFNWTDRLKRAKTKISTDGKGHYPDNPRAFLRANGGHALDMSRLWRSLKYECVYLHAWETGSQARAGVGRWITFYNHPRPCYKSIETDQQVQAAA